MRGEVSRLQEVQRHIENLMEEAREINRIPLRERSENEKDRLISLGKELQRLLREKGRLMGLRSSSRRTMTGGKRRKGRKSRRRGTRKSVRKTRRRSSNKSRRQRHRK